MQFFKNFRLRHRQAESEGDASALVPILPKSPDCQAKRSSSATVAFYQDSISEDNPDNVTVPVFVSFERSLPSFDPIAELYSMEHSPSAISPLTDAVTSISERITGLETRLDHLRDERTSLELDLADYRTDLLNTRNELYSEMLKNARQQLRTTDDFRAIQKLEARLQRFHDLFVDIGIPRITVDAICRILESDNAGADDILVDAIWDASNDTSTLLARLRPVIVNDRRPRSQRRKSKFWKKLVPEDGRHANVIMQISSDICASREPLTHERQGTLNAPVIHRRAASYFQDTEDGMFPRQRRKLSMDVLPSSLASHPGFSVQHDARPLESPSSSVAASSTSTPQLSYISGLSPRPTDLTAEVPTMSSFLPPARSSSQSTVLGTMDLNIPRSPSVGARDPYFSEEDKENYNQDTGATSTVTVSQGFVQGHRRIHSAAPRSAGSTTTSLHLSTYLPMRSLAAAVAEAFPEFDAPVLPTPNIRLPNPGPIRGTPAPIGVGGGRGAFSGSDIGPLLYGGSTMGTPSGCPTVLHVNSPPGPVSDSDVADCRDSRLLEHFNESSTTSLLDHGSSVSISSVGSHELARANDESKDSSFSTSNGTSTTGPTTPSQTPPHLRSTPSKMTGRSMLPVLKHLRGLASSATPSPDRLMNKLRGWRSPDWRSFRGNSECTRGSENTSPSKAWNSCFGEEDDSWWDEQGLVSVFHLYLRYFLYISCLRSRLL
ncbi:hypothetical protein BU15DRAFT_81823 [Melanogaster broomeanus]|nr:hypothetical protein BU15DRAFT_81823 [Melanogaster broomeanus]